MQTGTTSTPRIVRLSLTDPVEPVELSVTDWPGPDTAPPVLCIPGFTRTSRDFEELAAALAGRRRVLGVDLVGRGNSSRLQDPAGYTMRRYLAHLTRLVDALAITEFSVIGVSMGGLLAMALAAEAPVPVRSLVMIDVGPSVPASALDLLDLYLAGAYRFPDFEALLAHVRRYFAACNLPSELAWRWFALRGACKEPDGGFTPDYDPAIRVAFRRDLAGMEHAWASYDRVTAPTLVVRGEHSHVLPVAVAQEMTRRGPRATLWTIPRTGHWPALVRPEEIAQVLSFVAP